MTVSVVLRLVAGPLAQGDLVGHVHVVDTGEDAVVASCAELIAFLQSRTAAAVTSPAAGPAVGRDA